MQRSRFPVQGLAPPHQLRATGRLYLKDGGGDSHGNRHRCKDHYYSAAVTVYRDVGRIRARSKNIWIDLQCSRDNLKADCELESSQAPTAG